MHIFVHSSMHMISKRYPRKNRFRAKCARKSHFYTLPIDALYRASVGPRVPQQCDFLRISSQDLMQGESLADGAGIGGESIGFVWAKRGDHIKTTRAHETKHNRRKHKSLPRGGFCVVGA